MSTVRLTKFLFALLVAVMIGAGAHQSAQAQMPEPLPWEGDLVTKPENCDLPGIVKNRSSKSIYIKYDKAGSPYQWRYFFIHPGEDSTRVTCDADYLTFRDASWYLGTKQYAAKAWSSYIFNFTYTCYDHNSTIQCWVTGWNW